MQCRQTRDHTTSAYGMAMPASNQRAAIVLTMVKVTSTPGVSKLPVARARRLVDLADRVVAHPLVSYALIAALQLRVIWNVWKYKDLTYGDTSNYFINAASWMHGLH